MPSDVSSSAPQRAAPPDSQDSTSRWLRLLTDYGPPLLLMVLIFGASGEIGSSVQSGRIIGRLLVWFALAPRLTLEQISFIHYIVRKAGHVLEYALLAVLVHRAVARGRERWDRTLVLGVFGAVSLYAASDEFHQSFVGSRTGSAWDWLLDTIAAAMALLAKWRWEVGWRRRSSG